eukprot:Rhum_TRINITY_DN12877_c0_g1::Rhum_TRINITY_DN12877_c0_g1_i1::g.55025::m.55025
MQRPPQNEPSRPDSDNSPKSVASSDGAAQPQPPVSTPDAGVSHKRGRAEGTVGPAQAPAAKRPRALAKAEHHTAAEDEALLRSQMAELHGRILPEWEMLVCPELWGGYMQKSSLLEAGSLSGNPEVRLQTNAEEKQRQAADRDRRKAWVDYFQAVPAIRWHCAAWAVHNLCAEEGVAVLDSDIRVYGAVKHACVMASCLRPLSEELLKVIADTSATKSPLDIADTLGIPPRVVTGQIFANSGVTMTRRLWADPRGTLPAELADVVRFIASLDTVSCGEYVWERLEKLHMLEKALDRWCRVRGMQTLLRPSLRRSQAPRPSVVVSPCRLDDKPVNWFEVCTMHGSCGVIEELVCARVKRLSEQFGPGCLVMPYGNDEGFGASWDAGCTIATFEVLDAAFGAVLAEVLDKKLFDARCSFDRFLPQWAAQLQKATSPASAPPQQPQAAAAPPSAPAAAPEAESSLPPKDPQPQPQPALAAASAKASPGTQPQQAKRKGGRAPRQTFTYTADAGSW